MLAIAATAELDSVGIKVEMTNAILESILAKAFTGLDGGGGGPCGGPMGIPPLLGCGWLPPPNPPRHCAKALNCVVFSVIFIKLFVLRPPMKLGFEPDED